MILPHDSAGFAPQNHQPTPAPIPAGQPTTPHHAEQPPPPTADSKAGPWQVSCLILASIEVSRMDAATPESAIAFARKLAADLPLKVSIGGVPLPAKFKSL
jgi:hypothetical protein